MQQNIGKSTKGSHQTTPNAQLLLKCMHVNAHNYVSLIYLGCIWNSYCKYTMYQPICIVYTCMRKGGSSDTLIDGRSGVSTEYSNPSPLQKIYMILEYALQLDIL